MANPASVEAIDRETLTPIVRKALGSDTVEVIDWEHQPIYGGAGFIAGIFRFAGRGRDQGRDVLWSLILKSISTAESSQDPAHFRYGLREVFAYRSGLLDDLQGGLAAPACYASVQPSGDTFWIWLEEITEEAGVPWSLANYTRAARHLGQFNGAYLADLPLPSYRWLSRNWLPTWLRYAPSPSKQFQTLTGHPLHKRLFPADVAQGMVRLWDELHIFLNALDRLPQTLCHLDAYPRNLFAQHLARTVAIDWADMGIAPIGEDAGCLISTSLLFFEADLANAHELDQTVFAAYLDGLADAGWRGDPRLARFGLAASAALRWSFFPSASFLLENRDLMEQVTRRPLDEVVDRMVGLRRFLLQLADEARQNLPVLP